MACLHINSLFQNAVAGGYGRGYSEKNYDISLKTISFDDYGAECSVAYTSTTLSSVDSVWFVNGVPILCKSFRNS